MQQNKLRTQHLSQLVIALGLIILATIVSNQFFTRFDLTSDKRYTLSDHSKELLEDLNDEVYFKIYLSDDDLPAGFIRLQNATKELLDEFRAYGRSNIQYEFINPNANPSQSARNTLYESLYNKGLNPTNLQVKGKKGGSSQKIIFPGVLVSYNGKEIPVNILKQKAGYSAEENLNSSVQALEYELIFALKKLITQQKPRIGILEGHGELAPQNLADLSNALVDFYEVYRVRIEGNYNQLIDPSGNNLFDLLLIADPTLPFSEPDKFIIDQFIMNGGSTAWFINLIDTNIDSLAYRRTTIPLMRQTNLEDMLFRYGIRINPNIIQDIQCGVIPVNTALAGQQAKFKPVPWVFHPLLLPSDNHMISKNLDLVLSEFASGIDVVGNNEKVKTEFLLASSEKSKTINTQTLIDLASVNQKIDPNLYNQSFIPVAALLEGNFETNFNNRLIQGVENKPSTSPLKTSKGAKMLVVSDADIIRNRTRGSGQNMEIFPMGYDRYTKQSFGNKEFALNAINYLCNNENLMQARAKEHKLRLLDKAKIDNERTKWQLINLLIPVVLIVTFGVIYVSLRKRKFTR